MVGSGFDQLTRDLGAILSRRGLLRAGALGTTGLGLGVVAAQQTVSGKGKHRKKKKGDVNKLCKTQVADCETLLTSTCAGDPKCLNTVRTCCPLVGTCEIGDFFSCLVISQT